VSPDGLVSREVEGGAGAQVKSRVVFRALEHRSPELTLAKCPAFVAARVVEGEDLILSRPRQAHRGIPDHHAVKGADRNAVDTARAYQSWALAWLRMAGGLAAARRDGCLTPCHAHGSRRPRTWSAPRGNTTG
jgi:hypothetical protein